MSEFRKKVDSSLNKEFFGEINDLLKRYGVEDAEVASVKLKLTSDKVICPPGKRKYCFKTVDGKTICKCI